LVEAGAGGVEQRDQGTLERAPEGSSTLVVWVAPESVDSYLAGLASVTATLPEARVARRDRDEDEWRDAWKKYFGVRRCGRFVIVPSWERHQALSGDRVIALDPGRAFGTGGHATTRLCLQLMDGLADSLANPTRFLDVGCGSGVLAIAAALRFPAAHGIGVDIDADAVDVSRENAERNQVAARLDFSTRTLAEIAGPFALITANIQPEVLIPMAPALSALLSPGGLLLLSGILEEAAGPVESAALAAGLHLVDTQDQEGWRALALRS
jgi:ribosomal protein L11 methyltransferase